MSTITYRKNPQTNEIEKVTKLDDVVELVDIAGLNPLIQNLEEQIGGIDNAKADAQKQADIRITELDAKKVSLEDELSTLKAKKEKILADIPDITDILNA